MLHCNMMNFQFSKIEFTLHYHKNMNTPVCFNNKKINQFISTMITQMSTLYSVQLIKQILRF